MESDRIYFFCLANKMITSHFILYVSDQEKSTQFYEKTLAIKPRLNVPGMTEFELSNGTIFGLMPETGIKRLLGEKIKDPSKANGIPRAELLIEPSLAPFEVEARISSVYYQKKSHINLENRLPAWINTKT
jgi:catechol 2,3-dioxygenase-like lactoylglutathione lyase family enzyme